MIRKINEKLYSRDKSTSKCLINVAAYRSVPPKRIRACLHRGGGPQVGEVTRNPPLHITSQVLYGQAGYPA